MLELKEDCAKKNGPQRVSPPVFLLILKFNFFFDFSCNVLFFGDILVSCNTSEHLALY